MGSVIGTHRSLVHFKRVSLTVCKFYTKIMVEKSNYQCTRHTDGVTCRLKVLKLISQPGFVFSFFFL